MIKIYNSKENIQINIDDSLGFVTVNPKYYDEPPHFIIELKNGFNFSRHALKCEECSAFEKALYSGSNDWRLDYNGKKFLIITDSLGSKQYGKNMLKYINSYYQYGTLMQIEVEPLDEEMLQIKELESVDAEEFEKACLYRDLLKELNQNG
jgi:hypothetical protein